jgi:hypothetical protein
MLKHNKYIGIYKLIEEYLLSRPPGPPFIPGRPTAHKPIVVPPIISMKIIVISQQQLIVVPVNGPSSSSSN